MIKTSIGKTKLEGTVEEIMADYSVITKSIYTDLLIGELGLDEDKAKDKLKHTFDRSFEDPEKILCDSLIGILENLIGIIEDDKADVHVDVEERKDEEKWQ